MSDRRTLRSNGQVAHVSLQGQVEADRFTQGQPHRVTTPVATIFDAPGGRRDRELTYGAGFTVLDHEGDHVFGYALRDDYVGYVRRDALAPATSPATHVVHTRLTYALGAPDFKTQSEHVPLSLGAQVRVTGSEGRWAEIEGARFVPASHLRPLAPPEDDPVAVSERLIGTPYVWGGNSAMGIDCSGLVQAGCLACGIACPGDSDQQQASLGQTLPPGTPYQRGDILFWKGHVGWVSAPDTLLHANAFHMATRYEPLQDAITRIEAQGDGPVTRHARILSSCP